MSFFSALYRLLIGPLELFFEILFSVANRFIDNPGLSIIFLSLAMNFLVLPLYKRADAMQEEERQTNERLKHWTAHIKKTFTGDERFMILQTYYRQNNYKPTDALKGSVSLLLEIPFFMAAYNFLSKLPLLHGASLGPIQNLGTPDGLLTIGGLAINILPILMTAINLVSSAIYTKGLSTKSKVQLYVMAALFLVLLYDSPSGLVFYWTLNNLFSLVKNIFYKLKNPKKVLCILFSAVGTAALVFVVITHPMPTTKSQILLTCLTLLLQLPLAVYLLSQHLPYSTAEFELTKKDRATFWISGLFMTVLTGVMIPTSVIHTSPEEFINTVTHTSPLLYILSSALTAAGFFLVWFGVFYMLANNTGKKWMSYGMCALSIIAVVNFMFFGRNYGTMSPNLVFDNPPVYRQKLLNLLVIAALAVVIFFLWKKKQQFLRFLAMTAAVAALGMSVVNIVQIHSIVSDKAQQLEHISDDTPSIPLSRKGKNVVILMMDRAINSYFPYLLNEKPELQRQFQGFTYYPNTLSFGGNTNFGSPALYGGYEYTPQASNKRSDQSLASKQDEALKIMPTLFQRSGFEVTVFDPPYAGYDWIPDLSIFDSIPGVHAFNTMGMFDMESGSSGQSHTEVKNRNRNFFCYSLFKIAPVLLQDYLYDGGMYNGYSEYGSQIVENLSVASGIPLALSQSYAVLQNMSQITRITDDDTDTFLMMANDTTHTPTILQEPAYVPQEKVDNTQYDQLHANRLSTSGTSIQLTTDSQVRHYHVNMASFLKLGEWFDYLRENQVFDNTRIIIVSDHGYCVKQFPDLLLHSDGEEDVLQYNPILLVKDFNSQEFITDDSFMTNADTPTLAFNGVVDAPVNPFTGNAITSSTKFDAPSQVFCSHEFDITTNNGNTFHPGPWYSVHDDIFDMDNWEYLGVK